MGREIFRYWICYRDAFGNVHGKEFHYDFELDTGDAVTKAQEMEKFSNGDSEEDAINILTWKRIN